MHNLKGEGTFRDGLHTGIHCQSKPRSKVRAKNWNRISVISTGT
jgi:hypothetical protein